MNEASPEIDDGDAYNRVGFGMQPQNGSITDLDANSFLWLAYRAIENIRSHIVLNFKVFERLIHRVRSPFGRKFLSRCAVLTYVFNEDIEMTSAPEEGNLSQAEFNRLWEVAKDYGKLQRTLPVRRKTMNGTITKRPQKSGSVSWGYYFRAGRDASGNWIQITKSGFGTRREAAEAMRRAITEHEAGVPAAIDTRTFSSLFNQWMTDYAERHCAPKTIERYRELGAYAVRKFGTAEIHKLMPLTIERALHELEDCGGRVTPAYPNGRPLSRRTIRHIAFVVHGCLETAVRWGLLAVNPMNRVELPKAEKREAMALDHDRIQQLLKVAAGTRRFPLLVLAAATGCRRGELLALAWDDVDFENGVVTVSKSLEETDAGLRVKGTKSGKPRRFSLPEEALDVLREHRARQDHERELFGSDYQNNNLVFCRPDGSYYRPDKMSTRIRELVQRAGLKGVGLHTQRHSNASQLLSNGVPIPVVSKRLGHANPNVTLQIYSHALEADELAAAKIWNDAMSDVIQANRPARVKKAKVS